MVKNVPKAEMNSEFKKELRQEILQKIHAKKNNYYSFYLPILSGLSLCGVLIFVGVNMSHTLLWDNSLSFAPHIEQGEDDAFGTTIKTTTGNRVASPEYATHWGDMRAMAVGKMSGDMMPGYEPSRYQYTYSGKLDFPTGKLTVYKRNSTGFEAADTTGFIRNLRIDELDTKAFENAGISNINISEDREFGYTIGIDFTQWNINFNQNYAKWPQAKCDTNGCETPKKLTEEDIPSDATMIKIADAFTYKYKIDTSLYGAPIVNSEWRTDYMRQKQEWTDAYIPEMYTVTYPFKLDDKYVYEEFGNYKWLVLTIDIRTNKVSALSGLEKYNLISSKYNTLPASDIEKMVQSGGRYISTDTGTGKVVNLSLWSPTLAYVRIYGEWKDGISSDFLVPAYVFKVVDKPSDVYISDTVVVPLVEGFIDNNPQVIQPMAEPIMMK